MITWGGIDTTHCDPNINYVPLSSQSYWQFTLGSFSFGSYTMNKNTQAITSTGYTEFGFPSVVINAWLPLIGGTFGEPSTSTRARKYTWAHCANGRMASGNSITWTMMSRGGTIAISGACSRFPSP